MITEPEAPKEPPPEWEYLAEPPTISGLELDVVKLTAQFVARNGAQFLDKLMMREQRNYQFDFLRRQHPLFSYFTKLVEQYSKVLLPPRGTMNRVKEELENPLGVRSLTFYVFVPEIATDKDSCAREREGTVIPAGVHPQGEAKARRKTFWGVGGGGGGGGAYNKQYSILKG